MPHFMRRTGPICAAARRPVRRPGIQFSAEIGHWTLRGYGFWAVEETASGAYCGQVGLWNPEGWAEAEIGWLMMEGFEGKRLCL